SSVAAPLHPTAKPTAQGTKPLESIASLAKDYRELAARASAGDADAAMQLFRGLHNCPGTPLTPTALTDHIKQAPGDYPADCGQYSTQVEFLNARYQACTQFSPSQIDEWRKWVKLAADTGDSKSRLAFVKFARPDDPRADTFLQDTRDYKAAAQEYLA